MARPIKDIAAVYDCGPEFLAKMPHETWSTRQSELHRWQESRELALEQAAALRKLAMCVEQTQVPITNLSAQFLLDRWSDVDAPTAKRRAKTGARLVAACRKIVGIPKVRKLHDSPDAPYWGVELDLGGGITLKHQVNAERTCELVPLTNDDGTPKMETVTKYESVPVTVTTQATERKCERLFK